MKNFTIGLIIVVFIITGCKLQYEKTIQVKINRNVETLFILYSVVDVGIPPLDNTIWKFSENEFREYKQHEAVRLLDTIISRSGIDRPVRLIHHFTQVPKVKQKYPIDSNLLKSFSSKNNSIDGQIIVDEFIRAFSDFYIDANVEAFIDNYEDYYHKALEDVKKNLPPDDFITIMEEYYGKGNKAYILNPSPTQYPGWGFGSRVKVENELLIINTFGALNELTGDSLEIQYDFDDSDEIRELSVHEFGHSFINPVTELDEVRAIIEEYSYLFNPIKDHMSRIAYREWSTCVTEHIVRLGEIRIAYAMNDSISAERIRIQNVEESKFIYLPFLEKTILEYEMNRDTYSTIDDFIPKLIRDTFSKIDTSKIEI